jgi:hypothetical protein
VFFLIDEMTAVSFHAQKKIAVMPLMNPKLIQKAQQKMKEDPAFLTRLDPAQKKRAEQMAKKYGISLPQ